ncbi:hypothetical protein P691DRAFT_781808, partial [Macrolepiota fuliginosa MF-IS2]
DKPKSVDMKLGAGSQTFPLSSFMPEIHDHILKALNNEWVKNHTLALKLNEISLQFANNFVLEDGTATIMLSKFIQHYTGPRKPPLTTASNQAQFKHIIKVSSFIITSSTNVMTIDLSRKIMILLIIQLTRAATVIIVLSLWLQLANQPSMQELQVLLSQQPSHHVIHKTTKVVFKKIIYTINSTDGGVSFSELKDTATGLLQDLEFAKGSMKVAYEHLNYGTATIMLSKFIQHYTGPGKPPLTTASNQAQFKHIIKVSSFIITSSTNVMTINLSRKIMILLIIQLTRAATIVIVLSLWLQLANQPSMQELQVVSLAICNVNVGSMFRLLSQQPSHHVIHKTTKVVFKKIICTINSTDGGVSFSELKDTVTGLLQDLEFAKGSMKVAYELGVAADKGIKFADAFLLIKDITMAAPSPASHAKGYVGEKDGIMWLIEKQ